MILGGKKLSKRKIRVGRARKTHFSFFTTLPQNYQLFFQNNDIGILSKLSEKILFLKMALKSR